jgi:hypothetical protein
MYILEEWQTIKEVGDEITTAKIKRRVFVGISVALATTLTILAINYFIIGADVGLVQSIIGSIVGPVMGGVLPVIFSEIYEEGL